jgi:hypothetical protein
MFFVEIFLLLNFTVLCAILLALWGIRTQLEKIAGSGGSLGAAPPASAARPPAA